MALELGLILPILLMLVMGIVEFGRAYNTTISLNGAAREGARVLALCGTTTPCAGVDSAVTNSAGIAILTTDIGKTPCLAAGGSATVTVKKQFDSLIPYLPFTVDLKGKGVMRCGL